ncbi:MAG: Uncharacterized protein FD169_443 [Bacillota bacterium]|nr:MAG: Uncharacterized protein FD169_443 [Bacillota bacterium]
MEGQRLRVVVAWGLGLFAAALLWINRAPLSSAATPFVLAVFLAYLLNPLVDFFESRRIPRVLGIFMIYLAAGALIALGITYTIPRILVEINKLSERLPEFTQLFTQVLADMQERFQRANLPPVFQNLIEQNIQRTQDRLLLVLDHTVDALLETLGRVFVALLTPILAFYILKDVDVLKRTITNLMPGKHRRKLLAWLSKIDGTLGSWIRGQLLIAFMVGVLSTIGLSLIRLEFAVLLGVLAGMLDVIPYFGPIIGGIPPVIVGLLVSPAMGLKALVVIIVVQQIESNLITPQILGHSVGLHPLLVIFALLLGGELGGLAGLVLSVPVAAMIKATLEHIAAGD